MIPYRRTDAPAHWLLDLMLGGRVYRLADADLEIISSVNGTIEYAAGLPDLAITLGGDGMESLGIQIGPWPGDSWAELAELGADLGSGSALLRRWYEGTLLEQAEAFAQGQILEPEYETADDPIVFSIDLPRYDRTATVPARTERIDETTWPITSSPVPLQPDMAMRGAVYPRVYGRPGRDASFVWGTLAVDAPATPAYMGEIGVSATNYRESKLIIAGHVVEASQIYLVKASSGFERGATNSQLFTVETGEDLRGQTVSFVRRSGFVSLDSSMTWEPGCTWYVAWTEAGGVIDPETGSALRRLGQVLIDLLTAGEVPVARGRAEAARARLDRYLVDAVITEPVTPEDWIESQIGSLIPLLRRETPEGVWYEAWRYDAVDADVVADLVADPPDRATVDGYSVEQVSAFRYTDARAVENDLILRYLRSQDDYGRSVRLRGDVVEVDDAANNEYGSLLAALSQQRYGMRQAELSCDWIADDATAVLALQARLARTALARRVLTVRGGPELAFIEPNDVVRFTRSECGIENLPALVTSVTLGLLDVELVIELLERPSQRGRP